MSDNTSPTGVATGGGAERMLPGTPGGAAATALAIGGRDGTRFSMFIHEWIIILYIHEYIIYIYVYVYVYIY